MVIHSPKIHQLSRSIANPNCFFSGPCRTSVWIRRCQSLSLLQLEPIQSHLHLARPSPAPPVFGRWEFDMGQGFVFKKCLCAHHSPFEDKLVGDNCTVREGKQSRGRETSGSRERERKQEGGDESDREAKREEEFGRAITAVRPATVLYCFQTTPLFVFARGKPSQSLEFVTSRTSKSCQRTVFRKASIFCWSTVSCMASQKWQRRSINRTGSLTNLG